MKVTATRPVLAAGAGRKPGETFEADEHEATRLVWLGWAEKAHDEKKEKADDDAGKRQTRRAKSRS